ncbi:MAG: hypothetical protein JST53_10995 [Actinobacteria bacterium]|nr:hypothetical protein [Actinomycetota bacterium]
MEASGSDTTERDALAGGAPATGQRRAIEPDTDDRTVWLDTSEGPAIAAGDTYEREATERDTTDDWRIEPGAAPATVAELEKRIDLAVATAEAAEEAAMELGSATLEAAEQARRAAELAERASGAAARAASEAASAAESAARAEAVAITAPTTTVASAENTAPTVSVPSAEPVVSRPATADFLPRPESADPRRPDPFEERITAFRLRAEKVMIRLQKLEAGADPGAGPTEVVRVRP